MNSDSVIISPVLSEKSTFLKDKKQEYVFKVHCMANKEMIKKAIKEIFNVDPITCTVINAKPKKKRRRMQSIGFTSSYKKAVVRLKKDQKITEMEL
ncbi:MAG TPA: 50S ribosomal protein L23 [Spirochaetia bacterium]|nr:50S ribosomal protein L23 [Spirochaetia bacterium]